MTSEKLLGDISDAYVINMTSEEFKRRGIENYNVKVAVIDAALNSLKRRNEESKIFDFFCFRKHDQV